MQEVANVRGFLFNVVRDDNGKPIRVSKLKNNITPLFRLCTLYTLLNPVAQKRDTTTIPRGWIIAVEDLNTGGWYLVYTDATLGGFLLTSGSYTQILVSELGPVESTSEYPSFVTFSNTSATLNAYELYNNNLLARYTGNYNAPGYSWYQGGTFSVTQITYQVAALFSFTASYSSYSIAAVSRKWGYSNSSNPQDYLATFSTANAIYVPPLMDREFRATFTPGQALEVTWTVQLT